MPDMSRLEEVLSRCATGGLPARVAAMHVLMEAESPEAAQAALLRARGASGASGAGRLHDLERLLAQWDAPAFHLRKSGLLSPVSNETQVTILRTEGGA